MVQPLAVSLVLAATVLAACGAVRGVDPAPSHEVRTGDSPVRLVEDTEADLVLWVSNQSFEDARVRIDVAVDGVRVVDGDFHVEDQHHWIRFPLHVGPGAHEITAESDSGATLAESFRVPREGRRHAVVDHWTDDDGESPELTWQIQRRPLAFA